MELIRKRTRRWLYSLAVTLMLLLNWAVSGLVIWVTMKIRFWAFPLFFALGMGMAWLVFQVLLPSEYGDWTKRLPTWARNALVWVRKVATPDDAKFTKGTFWPRVRKYGAFWFVFAWTIGISPFVGAFAARYLKLPERTAWRYMTISVALMVGTFTSLYLGVLEPLLRLIPWLPAAVLWVKSLPVWVWVAALIVLVTMVNRNSEE
jgi:hypothetical protein